MYKMLSKCYHPLHQNHICCCFSVFFSNSNLPSLSHACRAFRQLRQLHLQHERVPSSLGQRSQGRQYFLKMFGKIFWKVLAKHLENVLFLISTNCKDLRRQVKLMPYYSIHFLFRLISHLIFLLSLVLVFVFVVFLMLVKCC